jgi:hypothetical protein
MTALAAWQNFYVIVGSSAGALIGLQFVVLTLIADRPITGANVAHAGATYATPTIVHFGTVLLLSGLMTAPWTGITCVAALWGLVGILGVVYSLLTAMRIRWQTAYQAVMEDWIFHFVLPAMAYATLAVAAYVATSYLRQALFCIAAAALALLFTGIHNAWDGVTYHVFNRKPLPADSRERTDVGTNG